MFKVNRDEMVERAQSFLDRNRLLENELDQLKGRLASSTGSDLVAMAESINGVNVLAERLDGVDPKALREIVDQLKQKLGSAVIVLATVSDDKVSIAVGVTKDVINRVKAGDLVNHVASQVGGKGGGRPDMAMAGGNNPEALMPALATVKDWVTGKL